MPIMNYISRFPEISEFLVHMHGPEILEMVNFNTYNIEKKLAVGLITNKKLLQFHKSMDHMRYMFVVYKPGTTVKTPPVFYINSQPVTMMILPSDKNIWYLDTGTTCTDDMMNTFVDITVSSITHKITDYNVFDKCLSLWRIDTLCLSSVVKPSHVLGWFYTITENIQYV